MLYINMLCYLLFVVTLYSAIRVYICKRASERAVAPGSKLAKLKHAAVTVCKCVRIAGRMLCYMCVLY